MSFSSIIGHTYELTICAIFQNEAPFLREWLEFHRMIGVEHFWLYNNNSTDNYDEILKPYVRDKIVELFDWPSPPDEDWIAYQNLAYADCMSRSLGVAKWVAAIDIDEFIVPTGNTSQVLSFLKYIEQTRPDVGGLMLNWQFFGTSRLEDIPEGKTMVESLLLKAPWNYGGNHQVKTICRPEFVEGCYVHCCIYKPGYGDMHLNGFGGPYQPVQIDPIRIHHYFPRTERYLREKKLPRRERYDHRIYSEEEKLQFIQRFDQEMNQVEDTTMLQYVPRLRRRLGLK